MNKQTFVRSERLKSEKDISSLFEKGDSLTVRPIRMLYQLKTSPEKIIIKIGFAVPKKNFKRAVDRNLLKRRMREAYRLNRSIIISNESSIMQPYDIMLVYQGQKIEDYSIISECIKELLGKLRLRITKK